MRSANLLRTGAGLGLVALLATACSDDDPAGNAQRFCGEIELHQAELTNPDLTSSDQIEPLLDLYRDIGELAPLAIEAEWNQLTLNYETASTIVPGDDESVQRALTVALQSEKSAAEVSRWLEDNCALDIGPVATISPQDG